MTGKTDKKDSLFSLEVKKTEESKSKVPAGDQSWVHMLKIQVN